MSTMNNTVKLTAEISATSKGLVDALNQASSAISSTSESWKSKFDKMKDSTSLISQSVKNLNELVGKMSDVDMDIDINGVEQLGSATDNLSKVSSVINEVSSAFDKVQSEVNAFTAQLVDMKNAASDLGMPIEEYQRFADAVKNAGMSLGEGENLIKNMKQNINDLANGVPQAQDTFSKLGLTIEQLSSNTALANFDAIVQALQSVVQPTEQAKASMELFKTSMEHAVNVSQEYNKLLVEQTNNAYATDKDVQTSISLAGAVEKLGTQLSKYAGDVTKASNANDLSEQTFEVLYKKLKESKSIFAELSASYKNWVDNVKSSVNSVVDASQALEILNKRVTEYREYASAGLNEKSIKDFIGVDKGEILKFLQSVKGMVSQEMEAIQAIMNQRIARGAPIDTKELEIAERHVQSLIESVVLLQGSMKGSHFVFFEGLNNQLEEAKKNLNDLGNTSEIDNIKLAVKEAEEATEAFREQIKASDEALKKGIKFEFDTTDIDKAREKTEQLKTQVDKLNRTYKDSKSYKNSLNAIIPVIDALKTRMAENIAKAESFRHKAYVAFRHPITTLKDLITSVREYINVTNEAKGASKNMGDSASSQYKQIAGQLLGMGSATAVIVKGFRTIGTAIKMYVIDPLTKAGETMRKFQEYMTKGQISAAENTIKKYTQMEEDLKRYAETVKKLGQTGSESDRVSLEKQQRMLNANYGIEVNPQNINEVMEQKFDTSAYQREAAIRSQIRAYEKLNEALEEEYKEKDSYVKNDLFRSLEEKNRGKERMVEIRREQGENNEKIGDLRQQLRLMGFEDNLGDWRKEQAAEEADKQREEREKELAKEKEERERAAKKAEEDAKRKLEAQAKAYDDALERLEDWGNALRDGTEYQKKLREIMKKYNEIVSTGVDEEKARTVAIEAINQLLKKEREEEQRKHDEFVKASEERTKAYKDAFKSYADANRAVVDAQKDYARTQKELANEAKSERIQRRRERLQKAMSKFGFTLDEGFKLNEKSSERSERRRNAQIDASIAEKLSKSQSGKRVSWTHNEKERIAQLQTLQKKDKQLDASQKAMEAANKQQKAAEQLQDAAKAIKNAEKTRDEATLEIRRAFMDIVNNSMPKVNTRRNGNMTKEARKTFENAKTALNAKGIDFNRPIPKTLDYSDKLDAITREMLNMRQHFFMVK